MGGQKESEDKKYISDGYEKLAENNIGSKLLKLMGWSGSGGLGKNAQGISEPVPITGRLDKKRSGLGQNLPLRTIRGGDGDDKIGLSVQKQIGLTGASFKHWARDLLSEYLNSPHLLWFEDLIFSSSFSKEERATLHSFCQTNQYRNQLVAKSYGRDEERHLVISRKLAKNGRAILADLIRCGDNEKFSLVIPENFYKWNGG
ncbi:NF-kappa-B-repressing factor-like [Diaphorina citri]|uniref:NF-kappa-B-repressing factor-like n=1 Tax=Diaphorina citri TaxID=121845 RepID=A0A1S3D7A2_DIACI|nr:NF-kappa-B-repressing factor-like [Diaphorina citri]